MIVVSTTTRYVNTSLFLDAFFVLNYSHYNLLSDDTTARNLCSHALDFFYALSQAVIGIAY